MPQQPPIVVRGNVIDFEILLHDFLTNAYMVSLHPPPFPNSHPAVKGEVGENVYRESQWQSHSKRKPHDQCIESPLMLLGYLGNYSSQHLLSRKLNWESTGTVLRTHKICPAMKFSCHINTITSAATQWGLISGLFIQKPAKLNFTSEAEPLTSLEILEINELHPLKKKRGGGA